MDFPSYVRWPRGPRKGCTERKRILASGRECGGPATALALALNIKTPYMSSVNVPRSTDGIDLHNKRTLQSATKGCSESCTSVQANYAPSASSIKFAHCKVGRLPPLNPIAHEVRRERYCCDTIVSRDARDDRGRVSQHMYIPRR